MTVFIRNVIPLVVLACCLAGCGGSGGGGGGSSSAPGSTVTGGVSANSIYPGTVKLFGVNADGTLKVPALAVASTDADGRYSASIGNYQGALVGIAFGSYIDEATNTVITIPESKGFYAALSAAETAGKSTITLPITALSDLAYRKARSAADFSSSISAANQAIGQLFGVDLVNTVPVPFSPGSLSAAAPGQIRLATILASISQYVATGSADPAHPTADDVQNALALIAAGTDVTSVPVNLSPAVSYSLQRASVAIAANVNAQPALTAGGTGAQSAIAVLSAIGSSSGKKFAKVSFRTNGSYGGKIGGITISVGLPAGFTMNSDANGVPANGMIKASGVATMDSYLSGQQVGAILKANIVNALGFTVGEFMTIYGEIDYSSSPPPSNDFVPITLVKIVDFSGGDISGLVLEAM